MLQVVIFAKALQLFKTYLTTHSIKYIAHNSVDANMAVVQYVQHGLLLF